MKPLTVGLGISGLKIKIAAAGFLATLALAVNSTSAFADFIFGFSPTGSQQLILNGSITLNATQTGWYDSTGFHDATTANYAAGNGSALPGQIGRNDFFVFDLSQVVNVSITSAVLSIGNAPGGFFGTGPDLYRNWDVTTSISNLIVTNAAISTFNDLGSGILFSSTFVGPADDGTQVQIALNGNALSALNASEGGSFAIGGSLSAFGAPGPIAGAGLPGLLAGFGVMLAWYRRRRAVV